MLLLIGVSAAHAQYSVTATWDRNSDSYTAGYRLYYGTSSGNYQWSVDAGNQTSAPLNLSSGTYYFVVRGYTSTYQYGPPSSEARFTAGTTTSAPTAAIQASLQNSTTALVSWQTTNAVSATINGVSVPLNGSSQPVAITGTTTFTITARSSTGATATASATVTVPTTSTTPAPTAAIQASLQNITTALLSWRTTNAVSATINGRSVPLNGSSQSVPISGTTTFTLTARSSTGATATASATVTVSTSTNRAPLAPTNMAASVSGSKVTLSWRPNTSGGTPTEYLLYVGTYAWGSNVIYARSVGNVLSVTGELPVGTYYARVRARNAYGTSYSSNQVSFTIGTKLASPSAFDVQWSGTKATLTWVASAADSADLVPSNYVLEAGTGPGLADIAAIPLNTATSFSADIPAGVYYVRVRARNDRGISDPTRDIILAAPGTAAAPRNLTAGGAGSTVNLSWAAPPAGGEAPAGYVLEAGSEPGLSDLAVLQVGNVTQFSTDVPPGTYFVRVRAVNSKGPGRHSNEVVVRK